MGDPSANTFFRIALRSLRKAGREGGESEGHKEARGHGFPAEGREERADARADFLAGEIGVPEDSFPGSPASIPVSLWATLKNVLAEGSPISEHQGVGSPQIKRGGTTCPLM